MRQWLVDPKIMCRKHLLGEHVEHHMFAGAINRGTNMTGFLEKNLLEPESLQARHLELVAEMERRGYNHKSSMPDLLLDKLGDRKSITVNKSLALAELLRRCSECKQRYEELKHGNLP